MGDEARENGLVSAAMAIHSAPLWIELCITHFYKATETSSSTVKEAGHLYLDDMLLVAKSQTLATEHFQTAVLLLKSLGFIINMEKSVSSPTQQVEFLDFMFNVVIFTNTQADIVSKFFKAHDGPQGGHELSDTRRKGGCTPNAPPPPPPPPPNTTGLFVQWQASSDHPLGCNDRIYVWVGSQLSGREQGGRPGCLQKRHIISTT